MDPDHEYTVEREPFFLDAAGRRLYAIHFKPIGDRIARPVDNHAVLLLSPFAEEMNRSRRMLTLQAEALARCGFDALVFDYSGTGDSGGEFAQTRWEDWQSDCDCAVNWLRDRGVETFDIVGIRLGAVLACMTARRNSTHTRRLVLWQPVVSGNVFITQFMRFRTASSMTTGSEPETTKELRARLEAGETLEIIGYAVSGDLAREIEACRLVDVEPPAGAAVYWFELSTECGPLSPASRPVLAAWEKAGLRVASEVVVGESFWSIQELTVSPDLIAATTNALSVNAG